MPSEDAAQLFLESWMDEVSEKKINPFMKFAKTVMAHKTGIVNFVKTKITNGIVEGINSKIQLAKRRARGYRKTDNFINMIYFLCGKLEFIYPLKTT
jgi:transposase